MNETVTIFCACPDEATAERLAHGLVENRHAACVNIIPAIRSVYAWQGKVESQAEALMLIKTSAEHFFLIEHWLTEHHPYEVPEVVAVKNESVNEAYHDWLWKVVAT